MEGNDSSQLTARVDEEDQTCEPVNPTPEVEGGRPSCVSCAFITGS